MNQPRCIGARQTKTYRCSPGLYVMVRVESHDENVARADGLDRPSDGRCDSAGAEEWFS